MVFCHSELPACPPVAGVLQDSEESRGDPSPSYDLQAGVGDSG